MADPRTPDASSGSDDTLAVLEEKQQRLEREIRGLETLIRGEEAKAEADKTSGKSATPTGARDMENQFRVIKQHQDDLEALRQEHRDNETRLREARAALATPPTPDQTPAPSDPTPMPDQTPAPSDPTPAPSDPTPAPSDPTPAPSDPTPAPSDPTPAPSNSTLPPIPPAPDATSSIAAAPTAEDAAKKKAADDKGAEMDAWERERIATLNYNRAKMNCGPVLIRVGDAPDEPGAGVKLSSSQWHDNADRKPGVYTLPPEGSSSIKVIVDKDGNHSAQPFSLETYGIIMDSLKADCGYATIKIDFPSAKDVSVSQLLDLIKLAESKELAIEFGPVVQAYLADPKNKLDGMLDSLKFKGMKGEDREMFEKWKQDNGKYSKGDISRGEENKLYLQFKCAKADLLNPKHGLHPDMSLKERQGLGKQAYYQSTDYRQMAAKMDGEEKLADKLAAVEVKPEHMSPTSGKTIEQSRESEQKTVYLEALKNPANMKKELDDIQQRLDRLSVAAERIDRNLNDEKRVIDAAKGDKDKPDIGALRRLDIRLDVTREPREVLLGKMEVEAKDLRARLAVCADAAKNVPDPAQKAAMEGRITSCQAKLGDENSGMVKQVGDQKKEMVGLSKANMEDNIDKAKSYKELAAAQQSTSNPSA